MELVEFVLGVDGLRNESHGACYRVEYPGFREDATDVEYMR
jgi:hypothetical protein